MRTKTRKNENRNSPLPMIEIRGARTHNLRNIDLDIPRGKLTVITGVSGSGKSSLALDTLFAEGQRQYLQSLSGYTRQFVEQMERPHVDRIRGLQPALCIDQQAGTLSPRSTVGTISEIYDFLRLLLARVGDPHCSHCGSAIDRMPETVISDTICSLPNGTRLTIMAPMVIGRKGAHADVFEKIVAAGLVRARVDGEFVELDPFPILAIRKEHTISAVVDRVIVRDENLERIRNSIQVAIRLSDGLVSTHISEQTDSPESTSSEKLYSTRFACATCGASLPEIEPRSFSFNSAYGACPQCEGFGTINDDASQTCPSCSGNRLRPESLAVTLGGKSISEIANLSIARCVEWLKSQHWHSDKSAIATPILKEIQPRLEYLLAVGLDYLSLNRPGSSLSGGELQRVRLATSVGTGLVGVCYVLDEPSIGLHPRDTDRLIEILRSLQARGNTVVVVEHDDTVMRSADMLVDIGPGAGKLGGYVLAAAPPQEFESTIDSLTAKYLSGQIPLPQSRNRMVSDQSPSIELKRIRWNNLKEVDLRIPLGVMVGVTGVSGSGKSSLIHDSLAPCVTRSLQGLSLPAHIQSASGMEHIDKLVEIDQSPIGRTPRSIPATYCGIWDDFRKLFASTRDAKQRGYSASRFSFNAGEGRCKECGGLGRCKLEMNFLEDIYVTCTECKGNRFNRATLAVRFKGYSIADVLEMSIEEAFGVFENIPAIASKLDRMRQVGLGYLAVGQSATTLSGGEAQRLKLANELMRPETGKTLYLFDEPTTGLHMDDVVRLIGVLQGLVEHGNSVVIVEHNMHVIQCCDWVVDVGPDGGERGGQIVAAGPPSHIAKTLFPTGKALASLQAETAK